MRILIELPTWLGDCVMSTPAIENIVRKFNDCELVFIGSQVSIELMKSHPKCKETYILDRKLINLISTISSIKSIDLFISFRSSIRTKLLKLLLKTKIKYQYNKNKFTSGHQVEKYNQFIKESIGVDFKAKKLRLFKSFHQYSSKMPRLGLNPGASYGSAKCWPLEKFVEVAVSLSGKFDIIIFGGPDEVDLSNKISQELRNKNCNNFTNLTGKTTIKDLMGYISSLDLFITGDSGPMHIAAAFQIPTVSIFGPTKTNETSQWMNEKSNIVKKELSCQPCMKRVCPLGHHDCMNKISSNEVINSALKLI